MRAKISFKKIIYALICFTLFFQQIGFAQVAAELNIPGYLSRIPNSVLIDKFRPLHLRYFSYDLNNGNFKFLFDKGDLKQLGDAQFKEQSAELLKYFLIGIILPDSKFWVNLRPDSDDRIIEPELEQTDLGKVLLEADLQLKKDTAKYTSPETPEGREYWSRLYKKAEELFGYEAITIPTLTRPWIVPGEIIVRETRDSAFIYKSTLKVMLEQDYLSRPIEDFGAGKDSATYNFKDERIKVLNEYSSQLIRELIVPKLTKEVNISQKYASLRQVFYSLILSRWFKARFSGKNSFYTSLIDSRNLNGLTSKESWSKTVYFKEYQKSFNDGEYSIKEPVYTPTGQVIRSYFSGGFDFSNKTLSGRRLLGFSGGLPLSVYEANPDLIKGNNSIIPLEVSGSPIRKKPEDMSSLIDKIAAQLVTLTENSDLHVSAGAILRADSKSAGRIYTLTSKPDFLVDLVKLCHAISGYKNSDFWTLNFGQGTPFNQIKETLLNELGISGTSASGSPMNPENSKSILEIAGPLNIGPQRFKGLMEGKGKDLFEKAVVLGNLRIQQLKASRPKERLKLQGHEDKILEYEAAVDILKGRAMEITFDVPTFSLGYTDNETADGWLVEAARLIIAPSFPTIQLAEAKKKLSEPNKLMPTSEEISREFASFLRGGLPPADTELTPAQFLQLCESALYKLISGRNSFTGEFFEIPASLASLVVEKKWRIFIHAVSIPDIAEAVGKEEFKNSVEAIRDVETVSGEDKIGTNDLIEAFSEGEVISNTKIADFLKEGLMQVQDELAEKMLLDFFQYWIERLLHDKNLSADNFIKSAIVSLSNKYELNFTGNENLQNFLDDSLIKTDALGFLSKQEPLTILSYLLRGAPRTVDARKPWLVRIAESFGSKAFAWQVKWAIADYISELPYLSAQKATTSSSITDAFPVDKESGVAIEQLDNISKAMDALSKSTNEAEAESLRRIIEGIKPFALSVLKDFRGEFNLEIAIAYLELLKGEIGNSLKSTVEGTKSLNLSMSNGNTLTNLVSEATKIFTSVKEFLPAEGTIKSVGSPIEDDWGNRRAKELESLDRRGRALRGEPDFWNEGLDGYLTPDEREQRDRQSASDYGMDYNDWKNRGGGTGSPITPGGIDPSIALRVDSQKMNPGGIDFRVMNIVTQPLVASSSLNLKLPQSMNLSEINLDEELYQMRNMLAAGMIPSGERIKEYLAACQQKGEWDRRISDIISCLMEICRLEEEDVSEMPLEIKEALIIADSENPGA